MRHLIIADIHSNLEAFEAVLYDAEKLHGGFESVWCLGDIVGYGPDPSQCIRLLRGFAPLCVCGNHDLATVGNLDIFDFNEDAALANIWNSQQLSDDDREFLLNLPESLVAGGFTLVHGSPRSPVREYITSVYSARESFPYFQTYYLLTGHCHLPVCFEDDGLLVNERYLQDGEELKLGSNRLIVNPGSVGQPRDSDPRASYAIYDEEEMVAYHYRCSYDIAATQRKMALAGLPLFLSERLWWGM